MINRGMSKKASISFLLLFLINRSVVT